MDEELKEFVVWSTYQVRASNPADAAVKHAVDQFKASGDFDTDVLVRGADGVTYAFTVDLDVTVDGSTYAHGVAT